MEREPLLRDRNSGLPTSHSLQPHHNNDSHIYLPYTRSSYYGDNYIVPPDRRRPRSTTQESTLSYTESACGSVEAWRFHKPFFICIVTLADIAALIYVCIAGGIETIGFKPQLEKTSVRKFGYIGLPLNISETEMVSRYSEVNGFVGPNSSFLVHTGAKFGPCMKELSTIRTILRKESKEEEDYKCCSFNGECGMMSNHRCPGVIVNSSACSSASPYCSPGGITVRPCCLGLESQCNVISEEQCIFQKGLWHQDKLLCSEVNCLDGICGMSGVGNKYGGHQWYRLFTPIFLHLGIVHLVLNLFFQVPIGILIEKEIGSIRLGLIYMISGVGGNLLCGIFNPMAPQVGASGALFGLVSLLMVKLVQFRHQVKRPCCELVFLLTVVVISFVVGTLPYIGNFVHIGGFVFGLLASMALLPYLHFGFRNRAAHFLLKFAFSVLLLSLLLATSLGFFLSRDSTFCSWCHYIDCVPYTKNFCPSTSDGLMNTDNATA